MLLSLLWYHATIMPIKFDRHSDIISQIENEAIAFIWGFGIHKISRSQIMLPKVEGEVSGPICVVLMVMVLSWWEEHMG